MTSPSLVLGFHGGLASSTSAASTVSATFSTSASVSPSVLSSALAMNSLLFLESIAPDWFRKPLETEIREFTDDDARGRNEETPELLDDRLGILGIICNACIQNSKNYNVKCVREAEKKRTWGKRWELVAMFAQTQYFREAESKMMEPYQHHLSLSSIAINYMGL